MLIACAALDETNLVACKIAHDVFGIPTTIARLRSPEFPEGGELLCKTGFSVDHVICPEESVVRYIQQLIDYPEALQVLEFSQGRAHLVAVRAVAGSPLVDHTIGEFQRALSGGADARGGAVPQRHRGAVDAQTRVLPGDEVFVLADKEKIRFVLAAIHSLEKPVRRVMIAGGGKVGLRLAKRLHGQCQVKIIERDRASAASTWPPNCRPTCWCCRATAPTRTC
jgi:trk system potassium uptake protein TrkA